MIPSNYDRRTLADDRDADDFITGCSPGCALTADEVERNLAVSYPVVPGSLRFLEALGKDAANVARFIVRLRGGRKVHGRVEVKVLVERTKITAYSDIRVTGSRTLPG
jgi:hypothetical protein